MTTEQLRKLETQISKDRVKYHISPVQLHTLPKWAKARLSAILPTPAVYYLDQLAGVTSQRIFDHWGMSPDGSLVGEPYSTVDNPEIAAKAKVIADMLGVRFAITNTLTSWWYPTKTVRVSFFEADDSKPLSQLKADAKLARKLNKTPFSN